MVCDGEFVVCDGVCGWGVWVGFCVPVLEFLVCGGDFVRRWVWVVEWGFASRG